MPQTEAIARIKINRLLEEAGWRFFDDDNGPANIRLEPNTKITENDIDAFGEDFEKTKNGFIDFLLLDEKGFPLLVLEAKKEDIPPLSAKEQARKYAKSQNCRFVILSNGNLHYFWDLKRGNPYQITTFPNPQSVKGYKRSAPDKEKLINEVIDEDYIALSQMPDYKNVAAWKNKDERPDFIRENNLKFLRKYQQEAVQSIQEWVKDGKERFLFEMATGTGKTLVSSAVIKLFLRSGNACRVLFLVDRLELEDQAQKAFRAHLKNDFKSVIYKQKRNDWRKAEIVVTTVQSLLHDNKYKRLFSPTDFDLVISDEAHRSIGGNARAVFEYFVGYKLGLTATPKDYLKRFDPDRPSTNDPREHERRLILDTYRTFGCANSKPTFRYSLIDGAKDGYLINPIVVDARTDITTQLLSDEGYVVEVESEDGDIEEETYTQREFEKKFFSEITNKVLCKNFLENALRDPISKEIGKTIVFAVSQHHAAKLTQILNEMADVMYPGKYKSDFAVQVTSWVTDAQQFTINFANNNLMGTSNFLDTYKTSKARVCVTVGMMTTGYDCEDILNLCLMRPIFSPTDFIQIKGRGTRRHNFSENVIDKELKQTVGNEEKTRFKLFDFFANCEYFEDEFNYDEVLELPTIASPSPGLPPDDSDNPIGKFENVDPDYIASVKEEAIGYEGMKIDRMFYDQFERTVKEDTVAREFAEQEQWDEAVQYVKQEILNKSDEFTIEKLRKAAGVDRRLGLREIVEKAFGKIERFKAKDELLEEEFEKFISDLKPSDSDAIIPMKYYFKAYVTDNNVRDIIETRNYTRLSTNASFTMNDFKSVPPDWRDKIPNYVKDYVPLNRFTS